MKMIDVFPTSPGVSIWPSCNCWVCFLYANLEKLLREIWKALWFLNVFEKWNNSGWRGLIKIKHGCMKLGEKSKISLII